MKAILSAMPWVTAAWAAAAMPVVWETPAFRYTISESGTNLSFVDRATGTDYLRAEPPSACAWVRCGGVSHPATAAALADGRVTLRFGATGLQAVLKTETHPSCVVLTVESIAGGDVEALTFLNAPLTLRGAPDEPFGACTLALNLPTRVDALPALQRELRASCEKKFGLVGAKVAIVAAPMARMLPALQDTLSRAGELPVCRVAGPWAREIPFNRGSYLFNFGSLTETNVEEWIQMTRSLGFTQIDNHGGGAFFRFGDFELNREKWPDGWETWRRIVARLHAAGIGSIFHTYAFFIDKQSKYVTPVPDPRLDAFRTFTLAEPLSAEATEIVVNESTANLSTITGFFEQNSLVLHLGDELVTFGGVSKTAPWKFTGVKRGALGTKPAAHPRGAPARHLKEMFGLFVPNVETTLFEEIAANHAEIVNRCGFDGVYLDAIDGSSILRGGDEAWYWAGRFVVEIQKRLRQPVGMEMSAMWHSFWQYRTRWQAWDLPRRGPKRFIDLHAAEVNGGLLLPLHLGWWGMFSFHPPQVEPTYPDVIEYLGAKLVGWDAGISLAAGVDRETLVRTPLFRRAADMLRTCEELRHGNVFDEVARAKLRAPGAEFALCTNAAGQTRFRHVRSQAQTVAVAEPWTLTWQVTNPFAAQPVRFRLEALMSAASVESTNAALVAAPGNEPPERWRATTAAGVSLGWRVADSGGPLCTLLATNAGRVARQAAWARMQKQFEPWLNLKDKQAIAVEVEGDASGALLAFRLESPPHLAYGAVADRYIPVDFTGRRRFVLIETESTRWSDYAWNDGKHAYHVYRENVDFGAIESLSIWLQHLAPGRQTQVSLGPIHALPLRAATVANPRLTVNGNTIEFPVELPSGSWLEGNGPDDCWAYGPKGESLGQVTPRGEWPTLAAGTNHLECATSGGDSPPRLRVVTFAQGEAL